MLELLLMRPASINVIPVQAADLLISKSQRLPRQHSSTRLQRLVGAACSCTECRCGSTFPLVYDLLAASCLSGISLKSQFCCPGLHEGAASQDRDMELPLDADQLEQIEEATATLLSSTKVFKALQTTPKRFHCRFHVQAC